MTTRGDRPGDAARPVLDLYQPLRLEGRRRDHLRRQPAPRPRHLRHRAAPSASTPSWCAATLGPPPPSMTTTSSASQLRRRATWRDLWHPDRLRGPGLGPLRRRLPAPGASMQLADHPGRRRLPGQLPRPLPRPRPAVSRTSPAPRSSTCNWPTLPRCAWTCCPGAGTIGCSPARAPSTRTAFVGHVLATGYDGRCRFEVFNDAFRQTDPQRTAIALRSLRWLQDELHLIDIPDAKPPNGFDFVEIKTEDTGEVEVLLGQLGFTPAGGTAASRCRCGARVRPVSCLNEQRAAISARRWPRSDCRCPTPRPPPAGPRTDGADGLPADLRLRAAVRRDDRPQESRVFWTSEPAWVGEFHDGMPQTPSPVRVIDHVSLSLPWQTAQDGAAADQCLRPARRGAHRGPGPDRPDPQPGAARSGLPGLINAERHRSPNPAPASADPVQRGPHVLDDADPASTSRSAATTSSRWPAPPGRPAWSSCRAGQLPDYLSGRFGLDDGYVAELRARWTCSTTGVRTGISCTSGHPHRGVGVLEFVQRFGGYDGYGVDNAVRLAAQRGPRRLPYERDRTPPAPRQRAQSQPAGHPSARGLGPPPWYRSGRWLPRRPPKRATRYAPCRATTRVS